MPSAVSWGSAWGRARTRHASAPGQVLTLPPMAVPRAKPSPGFPPRLICDMGMVVGLPP